MEGLFTSKDVLRYIAAEKARGISPTRELSLYFKATQKDLDEGVDNLRLWLNYIELLAADCDAVEIREIFKMLKLRYWRFREYWEALVGFEARRRAPQEFEEKVVAGALGFLRTKEFAEKEAVVAYLERFRARNLARGAEPVLQAEAERAVRFNSTRVRVPFCGRAGDTDLGITAQVEELRRGAKMGPGYPTPSDTHTGGGGGVPRRAELANVRLETVEVPLLVFKGLRVHVIRELGKGGSSRVFQVLHNDQIFALKRVSLREEQKEPFIDEIALLQKLRGKEGIIELVDYDLRERELDLLLECGDADLGTVIRGSALTLNFVRDIWEQILQIVRLVHEQRIIHKDLKPANFLFVRGRLKLIDFGISKEMKNDTTKVFNETQVGTVNYMSPESLDRDTKLGRCTDVWALGCILYEMVYGQTPLGRYANVVQKIKKLQEDDLSIAYPPTAFWELVPVMQRCLVKDRGARATVEELLAEEHAVRVSRRDLERFARRVATGLKSARELVDDFLAELRGSA